MIPEASLPSDPEKIIHLREATVQDVIDLADIDIFHEEQGTTLFLNQMQDRETRIDAKTWTAEDRRTILFWHWIHTAKDTSMALTYECDYCGGKHTFLQDMRVLGQGYTTLSGDAVRELRNGLTVKPLTGADMEYLERGRLSLSVTADEHGKESGVYRKKEAQIRLLLLLLGLHTKSEPSDLNKRVDAMEKRILVLTTTEFTSLTEQVQGVLADMSHGVETTMDEHGRIYLITPPQKCPDDDRKEAETRLRVPFRNIDYIPNF